MRSFQKCLVLACLSTALPAAICQGPCGGCYFVTLSAYLCVCVYYCVCVGEKPREGELRVSQAAGPVCLEIFQVTEERRRGEEV